MHPRVSLLVPTYNYGRFLAQALDSLFQQTLRDLEIIVIDDGSTDAETRPVLAGYVGQEPRLRVIRHERNRGHIASYNEGLEQARGTYVGIVSADDYCLRTDALERQVAVFEQHPRVGMVYSAHLMLLPDGSVRRVAPAAHDRVWSGLSEFRRLLWGNDILHSGTLLRRDVQAELGPYDPSLPQSGDWDLWLRAAARHDVGYIADPLYVYRQHPTNMQHKGLPPSAQAEQNWRTLVKAFAALPADAPADLWRSRPGALQHALLQTAWFDLHNGRRRRAWQGVGFALRRSPAIATNSELWRFLARLGMLTVTGPAAYASLTGARPAARSLNML